MYWCEGSKRGDGKTVDFANSDPTLIILFLKFLRSLLHVQEKKLRCYLYCFANQDTDNLIDYWSSLIEIRKDQFTKPYVRGVYNPSKEGRMPYGLLHIRYADKKLLSFIKNYINILPCELIRNMGGYRSGQPGQTVSKGSFIEQSISN